jgi:hypothetical protein
VAGRRGPAPYPFRLELVAEEEPSTAALIASLRSVRKAGEFGRSEFLAMCRWKSPRSAPRCESNSARAVRLVSRLALGTRDERKRLEALCRLEGVGIPTASAILTLVDPRRYGVLDIRVWKLLYRIGAVEKNPGGAGFRTEHWLQYLDHLRREARRRRVSVRRMEYSLFLHHQSGHRGPLYERRRTSRRERARASD